ncbi:acyclic terpene utilization AtuA family protein [Rhodococcus hoagii]|nr:acyclic terpene utilization AtuA family protein [Prescottella equi]
MTASTVRIGNCSGFYGDRISAMREMLEGGELDYLTGDYLAELTMLILGRDRMKDPARGYAKTFLRQAEDCLGLALDRGVKIVTNAGGLNPSGLADALREVNDRLGLNARIAHVEGDDLIAGALISDDVAVPLRRLGELTDGLAAIAERHGTTIVSCTHAADELTHPSWAIRTATTRPLSQPLRRAVRSMNSSSLSVAPFPPSTASDGTSVRRWPRRCHRSSCSESSHQACCRSHRHPQPEGSGLRAR